MLRPNQGCAWLERVDRADHVRELFPGDADSFGGIFGAIERIGHNKSNCVADMAHLVARQDGVRRHFDNGVGKLHGAWQKAEVLCLGPGEHKAHARHRSCFGSVDMKARMRMG